MRMSINILELGLLALAEGRSNAVQEGSRKVNMRSTTVFAISGLPLGYLVEHAKLLHSQKLFEQNVLVDKKWVFCSRMTIYPGSPLQCPLRLEFSFRPGLVTVLAIELKQSLTRSRQ